MITKITRWGDMTDYRKLGINKKEYLEILKDASLYLKPVLLYTSGWNRDYSFYTSHGIDHTLNIIDIIWELTQNYSWKKVMREKELLLLYLGAWFHDSGMIFGRESHGEKSKIIIERFYRSIETIWQSKGLTREDILILKLMCELHSTELDNFKKRILSLSDEKPRVAILSSILRFADTLDITPHRAGIYLKDIWEMLPSESKLYWLFHFSVMTIDLGSEKKPKISIFIDSELLNDDRYKDYKDKALQHIEKIQTKIENEINAIAPVFEKNRLKFPGGVDIVTDFEKYYLDLEIRE